MQKVKTLLTASAIAAAATLTAPAAMAEVEASVGLSSLYLFRGTDLSAGGAQMSGDITVSEAGFYASIWGSSENSTAGSGGEYDLIAGYGVEVGGVAIGLGVVNYVYPGATGTGGNDSVGDFSEGYLTLGFGGVEVSYWDNIAGDNGYEYYTIGYTCDSWSFLVGYADPEEDKLLTYDMDYTHVDITYAVTNNLSFTVSKIVDVDEEALMDEDTLFVVSYSLPIEIK